ncbi:MAG: RNA pyrophosphohydrolase [Gammaproteobacteria bacterium]|nr:RNA pyrophosphohydrolase [Gammaproteobacteria bacterium]
MVVVHEYRQRNEYWSRVMTEHEEVETIVAATEGAAKFRSNVGIMIVNRVGRILAGDAFHYPGEWMMPQGGIDLAESAEQAMRRELLEETGLHFEQLRLICEHDDWLQYLFRKPQYKDDIFYVGQRQKWFLLEYNGPLPDPESVHEQEFSCFGWVEPEWLVEQIPPFKKEVYRTVVAAFRPHFP